MVWLTAKEKRQFLEMYEAKEWDLDNDVFQAWLPFKKRAEQSEQDVSDVIRNVLESTTPKNIPKRQNKRQDKMPVGSDRFNPNSESFLGYLGELADKRVDKPPPKRKAQRRKL